MAKSLRSKSKRSYRAKKRETGKYAVAEAARLNRLNAKLVATKERGHEKDRTEETQQEGAEDDMGVDDQEQLQGSYGDDLDVEALCEVLGMLHPRCVTPLNVRRALRWSGVGTDGLMGSVAVGAVANTVDGGEGMALDEPEKSGRVSTHGLRGSRREEWRKSKGMDPIPKRHGMNRQGGLAARRKAGRPSRRR